MHRRTLLLLFLGLFLVSFIVVRTSLNRGDATTMASAGRTLVFGVPQEPDSLDPHQTTLAISSDVMCWIGGSLLALDPEDRVVPYLAERWETSEDGRIWTFYLKPDIVFHDGTPLRAQDYVYTLQRAMDPRTGIGVAGALLGPLETVEAPNDHTLVLTLSEPFFPLLTNLTACGYLMPLRQTAVEAAGDQFGRHPMSVGPYRFVSWEDGILRLERNPSFTWGPAYTASTPYQIEAIEYRFLPDETTRLAALEVGELDIAQISAGDIAVIEQTGRFQLYDAPLAGASPLGALNMSQPPFDDVRVRRAINMSVDRSALVAVITQNRGEIQYGPLSRSVLGYWPGVEEAGYLYNPDEALALLTEVGYTYGPDGNLQGADGPLRVPILSSAQFESDAQVLQAQLQAIGINATVEVVDSGTFSDRVRAGAYTLALVSVIYPDADILYLLFHSTGAAIPLNRADDTELDALLDRTRTTVDLQKRQAWVDQVQQRLVDEAYTLPLYTPIVYTAVSRRVEGLVVSPRGNLYFHATSLNATP